MDDHIYDDFIFTLHQWIQEDAEAERKISKDDLLDEEFWEEDRLYADLLEDDDNDDKDDIVEDIESAGFKTNNMNTQIDISPRKAQLKEEFDRLQKEYADLVTQREELDVEGPQIEALYMQTVGKLQYDLLMLQADMALLKKKRDMLQACINRGEKPDWVVIELELKVTFESMNEKLKREEEELNKAKEYIRQHMTEEEQRSDAEKVEIRTLYKRLVHRLHPDLHPDQTEWERNLFLKVQAAHMAMELEKLRQYEAELETGMPSSSVDGNSIEEWEERVEKLKARIEALRLEIEQLESKFPFTYRQKVHDMEWVSAKQEELNVKIAHLMEEKVRMIQLIEILKNQCDGESDSQD